MKIGKFSKETGLSIDTLRYYDKIGLLVPSRLRGVRDYTEHDLELVNVFGKMKSCGFTLDEIRQILSLESLIEEDLDLEALMDLRGLFYEKKQVLDKKQNELIQMQVFMDKALGKLNEIMDLESLVKKLGEVK